jgi:hypothetical protein
MDEQTKDAFVETLKWLVGPGAGVAIQWIMDWVVKEATDEGREPDKKPSPRTLRRLTYLVSILVPSAAYLLLAWMTGEYRLDQHVVAILSAFGVATGIHGETKLPNGAEVQAAKRKAEFDAMPLAGTDTKPLETHPEL